MSLTLEKKIISEVLQLYRDLPCLWNPSHALYTNKGARDRAINVMLEKYRILDSDANKDRMKKKIENMRTTYRRERVKVIKSQMRGGDLYEPALWYYNELKFLDELSDGSYHEITINDDDDEEHSKSPPPVKRLKTSCVYLTEAENDYIETVKSQKSKKKLKLEEKSEYLVDNNDDEDNEYQEQSYSLKNDSDLYAGTSSGTELFGKALAVQLSELQPKQRFIAEKLISDVIFLARLEKLKTGTKVELNDDCF